jgi:GNAT superfamily N-acetyltransferase
MMFAVRDASRRDLLRLQDLFRQSSLSNEGDRDMLLAHPEALEFSESSLSAGRVRVAVAQTQQIVGFATTVLADNALELVDLFTDPAWMRRGVASRLISDVVAYAIAGGIPRITVTGNPHAAPFYQHAGFEADGEVATPFGPGLRMHLNVPT